MERASKRRPRSVQSPWTTKIHRSILDTAEDLTGAPRGGAAAMWLVGVEAALGLALFGLSCVAAGNAFPLGSRGQRLDLSGPGATALGAAWVALGSFLHFHYFYFRGGLRSEGSALGALGKIGALLAFAGAPGFVLVHFVFWT